jgi:Effector protein
MTMRIPGETYQGPGRLAAMPADEAQRFRGAFDLACNEIGSCRIGMKLLEEIEAAARELRIVKAGEGQANSCVPEPQTEIAKDAACYREVLGFGALKARMDTLTDAGLLKPDHAAVRKFTKFCGPQSGHSATVKSYKIPLAHKPKDGREHSTDDILRTRINLFEEKKDIREAVGFVTSLQRGLIAYHIMEHLTPGPGTGAYVVWNPDAKRAGGDQGGERAAWMDRPNWVALAHELIHGWRLVTGRCVFRPEARVEDYYEEAMTVGLPPYDACRFTENRFRQAQAMPLRTFYGPKTKLQSEHAQKKHGTVDERLS